MGLHRLHATLVGRALLLAMIAGLAGGGCWEEIHYTGPDPSAVARREPVSGTVEESPAASDDREATANEAIPDDSPPSSDAESPVAPEEPTAETELASEPVEEPAAEETAENDEPGTEGIFDEPSPEQPLIVDTPSAAEEEQPDAVDPALATRRAAWQVGSKLTLAAMAHDRSLVPDDAAKWFAEARSAAEQLGTTIDDLPEPSTADEINAGSRRMHDYLFQQGQRVYRQLADRHGADHATLFEASVKSNVLLVLYQPGSSIVEPLAGSIRDAAPKADLPLELLQPLLDTLAKQAPIAEVRVAVRQMHADVERYLTEQAEQK